VGTELYIGRCEKPQHHQESCFFKMKKLIDCGQDLMATAKEQKEAMQGE
jgi:hypothetical protein